MEVSVVIVAGGLGSRMGSPVPKQFLLLHKKPVLAHTLQVFYRWNPRAELIVVLPENQQDAWQALRRKYKISTPHITVAGGRERFHSVQNGLAHCHGQWIMVHDGVRPMINSALLQRCYDGCREHGTAIPVMPVTESIRTVSPEGHSKALNRAALRTVQTPQCFRRDLLKAAYKQSYRPSFTDDASVVESHGTELHLVDGLAGNIKITRKEDLVMLRS